MAREKTPAPATPRKRAPRKLSVVPTTTAAAYPPFVDPQKRNALIARAAYFRALHRGFAPGHEVEDWLAAEAEVDANLLKGTEAAAQG
jgi:hypothetical protein